MIDVLANDPALTRIEILEDLVQFGTTALRQKRCSHFQPFVSRLGNEPGHTRSE